ncbi:MAG: Rrf2 family transcriptional regulator [Candidatus Hydrogenedens sp.]|nr:Rrf2 family transcriptional regulator [Candidatus Hydrogenedentota bacterium]NLF57135.1 Rrf2 family transcriptional regulator [Candidatus Hydrogenedens sp.]
MISKTAKHALRACIILAQTPEDECRGAASIAGEIDAPANYLGKLLKTLAERGVLDSQKGAGGGFHLAKPAEKTLLIDIVDPFDKVSAWKGCLLGNGACSPKNPCAMHNRAAAVRDAYLDMMQKATLAEVAGKGGPAV